MGRHHAMVIVLLAAASASAGDWSGIMRDAPVKQTGYETARVRESTDKPVVAAPGPAKLMPNGYFYRQNPAGDWEWCEECNGFAWRPGLQPKQAAAAPMIAGTVMVAANPTQPGGSPGQATTPGTTVHRAVGPSTWSNGSFPAGSTYTPARVVVRLGSINAGCVSGG